MSDIPKFFLSEIDNLYIRENFNKLREFLRTQSIWVDFRSFEVEFKAAEANRKFSHNLGFLPKDILVTSLTGAGIVLFNQELSTKEDLNITASDACVVRFVAGTFREGN